MGDRAPARSGGIDPSDVREPTAAERVRALPMVSVALGSLALGFCIVYFVCRPEEPQRSQESRLLADGGAVEVGAGVTPGASGDLLTDVDVSVVGSGGGAAAAPDAPGVEPAADAAAPPGPRPEAAAVPPPPDETAPSESVFGSRLTLTRVEVRKCAGADGVEIQRERCGRVRGIELFMARGERTTKECIEESFPVEAERPSVVAVTLAVDFEAQSARVSIPGADEARRDRFRALRECLTRKLGVPDFAHIDHPHNSYRFVFAYSYSR